MTALDELIKQIPDENLRERIKSEVDKLTKKFGLVFESKDEFFPRSDLPVKKFSLVAKVGKLDETFTVTEIDGDKITCSRDEKTFEFTRDKLICVNRLGSPIYPGLTKIDEICNAPNSELWHLLIEAENYHALQLLKYPFAGKVDCIYIDPPYNTGARDWKYNDAFVDAADRYNHSKWLAMMERRLLLAKELLSDSGAIFISIDDNEQATLKLLCDKIFGAKNFVANIAVINNFKGRSDDKYIATAHEYLLIYRGKDFVTNGVPIPDEYIKEYKLEDERGKYRLQGLRKRGANSRREDRPNMFYPFFYDEANGVLSVDELPDATEILPYLSDGSDGCWRWGKDTARERLDDLIVRKVKGRTKPVEILPHLSDGTDGRWRWGKDTARERLDELIVQKVKGRGEYDVFQKDYLPSDGTRRVKPKSFWLGTEFSAESGTLMLKNILGKGAFNTAKPLGMIECILQQATNKNSLVLDFFAGSGTTLHAVNLLNAEDGGNRRCILVTNNEGDIARSVTWPRTTCSIKGHDINGTPLNGNYLGTELAMSDGFKSNAAFFALNCLDKNSVELGEQFNQTLPVLWLKAGGIGHCPTFDEETLPPYKIFAENKFAVLFNESYFAEFQTELDGAQIETFFAVTGSESALNLMAQKLRVAKSFRLYEDYLENFKLEEVTR